MRKIPYAVFSVFFLVSTVSATESTTVTLDYIRSSENGTYHLYGKNIPSDHSLMNLYINDKKVENSDFTITQDGVDIKNFYRNSANFVIERMKTEYGSGDIIGKQVTENKTEAVKIRKKSDILFSGQVSRENKNGYDVITLPFIGNRASESSSIQLWTQSEKKIIVNGQEKLLVEYASEYKDNVYYFTPQWITFIGKNLSDRINTIGMTVDGLASNYVTVVKEGIVLDSPSRIEIEDTGITKNLRLFFWVPRNMSTLNNKDIFINGMKIDSNQATLWLGQFVIRYDLSKLAKDQDALSIIIKDNSTNEYSNERIVQIDQYSRLAITQIDTGKAGSGPNFTFRIIGNSNAFLWDIYKMKISLNGTDYTRDGTKELVKNGSGVTQKDSDGADRYEIKNKIDLRKTGENLEFDFPYSLLKNGENIVSVKNENTGRESNKVSFVKDSADTANYQYLTGSELTESTKKESLEFEVSKDGEKKINPTNMAAADRSIPLGKLKFLNIRSNAYYSLSFTIDTNFSVNPFSSLTLDGTSLETIKNKDTLSFSYKKQWFGKDFRTDMELLSMINELYNVSDTAFSLHISEISLKKLSGEDYETIASLKNPLTEDIFYLYSETTCFDGSKDFCALLHETDPLLNIIYGSKRGLIPTDTENTASNTGSIAPTPRKNIAYIVTQDFNNNKFTKAQDLLVKKYEVLKKKGSVYIPTFRKALNNLLFALKNIETKTNVNENIIQVKSSIKTLSEVLRNVKKE